MPAAWLANLPVMSATAFRTAIEAMDVDAAVALMADDVVFESPVVFKPYVGREAVATLLHAVAQTFEDFSYVDQLDGADGSHVLVFSTRVWDRRIGGIDYLRFNAGGQITQLTVMVRPLSGAHALAEAMAARLQAAQPPA